MGIWYQRLPARIALHAAGLALLSSAWVEGGMLRDLIERPGGGIMSPGQLLLAAILFASASLGSALTIVGPGLWAPVALSDRWSAR